MPISDKPTRQGVSLPTSVVRRIRALAKARRSSASRVLVDLIESGLAVKEQERSRYLALLERLRTSDEPAEQERVTLDLARLTFGE